MTGSEKDTDDLREGLERVEDLKKKHLDGEQDDRDGSQKVEDQESQPRD